MYLPLVEFFYNNSYHASIDRPPLEMLYGRECRTPIYLGEVIQRVIWIFEVVSKATELIQQLQSRLQTAQSRHKSYADKHRSDLEFHDGDIVLLKMSPWKGVIRLRKRGMPGPRYISPFRVITWWSGYRIDWIFRRSSLRCILLCMSHSCENVWLIISQLFHWRTFRWTTT